mmetsp:Transcript_13459/g.44350  ORF Transcript_13459/g.44350 Transcript_13459/m.44350 type:complete len:226 (+) Transcript_13459:220-897(+)
MLINERVEPLEHILVAPVVADAKHKLGEGGFVAHQHRLHHHSLPNSLRLHLHNPAPAHHLHGLVGQHALEMVEQLLRLPRPKVWVRVLVVPNDRAFLRLDVRPVRALRVELHDGKHRLFPLYVGHRARQRLFPLHIARAAREKTVLRCEANLRRVGEPLREDALAAPGDDVHLVCGVRGERLKHREHLHGREVWQRGLHSHRAVVVEQKRAPRRGDVRLHHLLVH